MIQKVLDIASPLLFAAIGGLFSEITGTLNIALEGFMLLGAFLCVSFSVLSGSFVLGMFAALFGAVVFSLVFSYTVTELRTNIFISGLGVNLLIAGTVSLLSVALFHTKGVIRFTPEFVDQSAQPIRIFTGLSLLLPVLAFIVIEKTSFGLRMRTAGYNPDALAVRGVRPETYTTFSLLISGILAAGSGVLLSLNVGAYVPNISAGRGWIGLVLIYLGNKKPFGILVATLAFSAVTEIANMAQGLTSVSHTLILALPQGLSILGLTIYAVSKRILEKHT
ncbi:MAG TPA: ABC transporter permease [Spirochaetia bacterium]|nr:ABC transporter permease [Spirochaetia bacterium]